MDSHGYLKHLGRLKDLVIRGGENIYPREIEEFLHQHPKIADVYVVGVPDKRLGEELCACVKVAADQVLTQDEVKQFCEGKVRNSYYFFHLILFNYVIFSDCSF